MDVSVGTEGVRVRTESVQSLLYGGIAFDTPDSLGEVKQDADGSVFTLYDDPESIQAQAFTKKITFILFFDGSVRGLQVGAPVEFKGIKIGSVVDVRLEFDSRDTSFRIPVLIEIEPERVLERDKGEASLPLEMLTKLVDRGLRAQLQAGNLITGQLFVDLDMHPNTPVRLVNDGGGFPELPTIPAGLEQMTASVQKILAKLEAVDVGEIARELVQTLQGTSRLAEGATELINKPELQGAVHDLRESLDTFKRILHKLDRRVEPVTRDLEDAIGTGRQVLEKTLTTMTLVEELLRPDSPLQYRFIELSEELAETARSIRTLVDLLERSPNSFIFGKSPSGEK
jgi:paraquat-inducible protein B